MPSFQDPVSDGAEACTALRALAHATRTFDNPAQTYEVVGDLLGGLRSLEQVLDQLALAHTNADAIARTDDGDHWAGVEEAHAAALALRRASTLVARAGLALDRASQHSGRIAWDSLSTPEPVSESLVPRVNAADSFQPTGLFGTHHSVPRPHRRDGMTL
ncbi:hypothetical protein ACFUTX_04935 [Microbacterium sp. NPDC057407]|uniref:hypothetical protein n=1 Tax=Microbacterium TaxID=33882 RepID=UPI00076885AD|nr:hypothetical protein [Microbacterium hominis]KXC04945.1 hypothetical protein MhomT_13590 [Microbacterium hominis]